MIKAKFLVLTATVILMSNNLFAQLTINLDSLTGPQVNGTQVQATNEVVPFANLLKYFYVTNNSGVTQDWIITRKIISEPNDWSNYICWAGLCYSPSPLQSWSSDKGTLADGKSQYISAYVTSSSEGNAHYRYYISTDAVNFIDSVDMVVSALKTGIAKYNALEHKLFPNPAIENITITQNTLNSSHFMLFDNSGKMVLSTTLTNTQSTVNISQLKSGYYTYSITDSRNGKVSKNTLIIAK